MKEKNSKHKVHAHTHRTHTREIYTVSVQNLILNSVLALFKLVTGLIAHSTILISEAIHTASDAISTLLVMISLLVSRRNKGQDISPVAKNLERIVGFALSLILISSGIGIGYSAVEKIRLGLKQELEAPGALALVTAGLSILIKEWMFRNTKKAATVIESQALMADAWHHRTDALTSIGTLAGLLGARIGFPILDPIAGIVLCLFIVKHAVEIFISLVKKQPQS